MWTRWKCMNCGAVYDHETSCMTGCGAGKDAVLKQVIYD